MKPILAVKLRDAFQKAAPDADLTFTFRNIIVNGVKRGCSGFVRNNVNNTVVYINTERSALASLKNYMFRFADHEKDYTGYSNRWADTVEELVGKTLALLQSGPVEMRDCRI